MADIEKKDKRPATNSSARRAGSSQKNDKKDLDVSYTQARKEAARNALSDENAASRVDEIIVFIYLAVALFLLCSNFGWCGPVGRFFSQILFGLFGTVAYILPIYGFFTAAFILSNGAQKKLVKRVFCVGLFIIALGFVFQFINDPEAGIKALYSDGAKSKIGGGVLLGGIFVLLHKLIGTVGSIIVMMLITAIGVITVMDVSLIDIFKTGVKNKKEKNARQKEERKNSQQYTVSENPNKDKDMLRSNEVLADNSVTAAQTAATGTGSNSIVKNEEVHEIGPSGKTILGADSNQTPIDYFNITPDMSRNVEHTYVNNQPSQTYSEDFFAKTDFYNNANSSFRGSTSGNTTTPGNGQYMQGSQSANESKQGRNVSDLYAIKTNTDSFNPFKADVSSQSAADNNGTAGMYSEGNADNNDTADMYSEGNADNNDTADMYSQGNSEHGGADNMHGKSVKSAAPAAEAFADKGAVLESKKEKSGKLQYKLPPIALLKTAKSKGRGGNEMEVSETAQRLKSTLENFGVNVTITDYSRGPSVTRYELLPEQGVKVSKILGLADDIKLNLAAADIRIEAPIPGKAAIGIEVPNKENDPVYFRDLLESEEYKKFPSKLAFAVGKDIGGKVIVTDIAKMPHLLVAGATGSGKSVCINTLIMSILYKAHPKDVKLIMVDPKQVELNMYNGIPHMLIPVVTDPKKAAGALNWAVMEMTNRYQEFAQYNVRNIQGYNEKVKSVTGSEDGNEDMKPLPQIVIIIDELADLMMVAGREVEDAIVRLTQLARAAGIHLIIATQRPSVDVITGLIKANVPSRIAMTVSSGTDSRTIIDQVGAEKLLGKGDMLFYPTGYPKPVRVQGAYLSDEEIEDVCDFIKNQGVGEGYDESVSAEIANAASGNQTSAGADEPEVDDYFADAGRFIIGKDKASIGMLQRVYKIGFNRAARIMDQLSEAGVVGPEEGTKPRKVLMTMEEFENYCEEHL